MSNLHSRKRHGADSFQAAKSRDEALPAGEPKAQATKATSSEVEINIDGRTIAYVSGFLAIGLIAMLVGMGTIHLPQAPSLDSNTSLWLFFFTGLTAGGLSCLAVQGGLLASTIAQREKALEVEAQVGGHVAPILLFLSAKITAYTCLGLLLGAVGSMVQLSPQAKGFLNILLGLFMIAIVLSILDVHPIFRYLAFQPPKRIQRLVRGHSRRDDALAPLTLGALTVFIPCAVTQAVMLTAVASGSPVRGALMMFAFTLGTAPLFAIVGYLATRMSTAFHKTFMRLAAVAIAVIALLSIQSGWRLFGGVLPSGRQSMAIPANGAPPAQYAGSQPTVNGPVQEATINVQDHGYDPERLQVKAGLPIRLNLVTNNIYGCTLGFVIPSLGIQKQLMPTGKETVLLAAASPGEIPYTCSMGMYSGVIEVMQ